MPSGDFVVGLPCRPEDWDQLFALRWRVLRAPWAQPFGSERDELESEAVHRIAVHPVCGVVGGGRWHRLGPDHGQVRYMAVAPEWRGRGVGAALLAALEQEAVRQGLTRLILESREEAVPFYLRHGYRIRGPGKRLFGEIPHHWMEKHGLA